MPANTAIPVEPLTPEEDAALKTLTLRKLHDLAERNGWLTSPAAKAMFNLLAMLLLGAGAGVVSRFAAPVPVTPDSVVIVPTDETGKLIVAEFARVGKQIEAGFGRLESKLDAKPAPPVPKPPEPAPPLPEPDDWGEAALPSEIKAKAGRQVTLEAKVKGECRWLVPPGSPCDRTEKGRTLAVTPIEAVDFAIGVVSIPDGVVTWTTIKAAPPAPKPPGPGPNPPTPIPPAPASPLTIKLQAAYLADAVQPTAKDGQRMLLKGLYEAMTDHARKPEIVTTTDLLADLKAVSSQIVPASALVELRKIISAEVVAALGTTPAAKLDPELRPKAVDVFAKIAKSLGEVK